MNLNNTILKVVDLGKTFTVKKKLFGNDDVVSAVSKVSFSLHEKEVIGIVGESGCGKSTLARLLIQSIKPDSGIITLHSDFLTNSKYNKKQLHEKCKKIQMVYQNPYSSLNPKMTVLDNVTFGPMANGTKKSEAKEKALKYLDAVGIKEDFAYMYPKNLSGGQRQRVAIARALAMEPEIVLADEPVSALDKSVQAQVLNLFSELKEKFGISIIFISHDLSVVEYMSDNIIVMYLGEIVEKGSAEAIYSNPCHPYTRELMSSVPDIKEGLNTRNEIGGEKLIDLPSPINPPSGCRYHPRCKYCMDICSQKAPQPKILKTGQVVFCHRDFGNLMANSEGVY